MELVIHRDKLESSTERERRKKRQGKGGVEKEIEECLETRRNKSERVV